ncbi:Nramp family divalent metal transporter [Georgenia sp. Z1491]|uniref:Nramp family divalent metal transporter n=1 Tax=Georgenia sp. Z1491 TaxID=3416707 RepID=UPI003CFB42D9
MSTDDGTHAGGAHAAGAGGPGGPAGKPAPSPHGSGSHAARPEGSASEPLTAGEAATQSPGASVSGRRAGSRFGPGLIIAASFIGPGTITTSIVTGADYGHALAWTIVFSIVATIILQEMTARLGLGTRRGLGEAMREVFHSPVARLLMAVLVVAAIGIGGASYAGGDTSGTALAVTNVVDVDTRIVVVVLIALIFALLWTGSYKLIEKVLMAMVAVLVVIFVVTAVIVRPNLGDLLGGMFVPSIPPGAILTAIALIGTTVVPYNLFLQAQLVKENWGQVPVDRAMKEARTDTAVSIGIGGLITLAVMVTAVGSMFVRGIAAEEGTDLAEALTPLLGDAAPWVFALGLFAAGFTSAIAGPLGAAYAITGVLGLSSDLRSTPARIVWVAILVVGGAIALTGFNPIQIIVIAQAANGLLLPIVAIFLMSVMNNRKLMGKYRNGPVANVLGWLIVAVVVFLAGYQFADIFGLLPQ